MHQIVGSIIKVKPDFEERYTILHQYTFPDVLKRIRESNIRNYSIFLRDHLLFSYYEYFGRDFKSDMAAMADDVHTQNWWKLTDPMQEPVPFRAPDEWWAQLENPLHLENPNNFLKIHRFTLSNEIDEAEELDVARIRALLEKNLDNIKRGSLFKIRNLVFLYAEADSVDTSIYLGDQLNEIHANWLSSKEVFHTD